jgi:hypothetical protein
MSQAAIGFSLMAEFLGQVLIIGQIAKDCTQDTLKKSPFSLSIKARILRKFTFFRNCKNALIFRGRSTEGIFSLSPSENRTSISQLIRPLPSLD